MIIQMNKDDEQYDCLTQNKRKSKHSALVAKPQGASSSGNAGGKKKIYNPRPEYLLYLYHQALGVTNLELQNM